MDVPTPITATQMLLVWILLGFLIVWMITFTVLAFYPKRTKKNSWLEDLPTPSRPLPVISAPKLLRVIASPSVPMTHDASGDVGSRQICANSGISINNDERYASP